MDKNELRFYKDEYTGYMPCSSVLEQMANNPIHSAVTCMRIPVSACFVMLFLTHKLYHVYVEKSKRNGNDDSIPCWYLSREGMIINEKI